MIQNNGKANYFLILALGIKERFAHLHLMLVLWFLLCHPPQVAEEATEPLRHTLCSTAAVLHKAAVT